MKFMIFYCLALLLLAGCATRESRIGLSEVCDTKVTVTKVCK